MRLSPAARSRLALLLLVALALLLRLPIALSAPQIIDADEAVNALEALHIAQGRSLPLHFYGTDYLGAGELYLTAGLFELLGVSGVVARLPALALSCLLVALLYLVGRCWFGEMAGLVAGLWVAAGPLILLTWGAKAYTGYLMDLVLGTLALALVRRLGWGEPEPARPVLQMACLGLLLGLGVWCHPIIAPFAIVAFLAMVLRSRGFASWPRVVAGAVGLGAGAAPLIWHNLAHGGATIRFLASGAEPASPARIASRGYNLAVAVLPALFGGGMTWSYRRPQQSVVLPPVVEASLFAAMLAAGLAAAAVVLGRHGLVPQGARRALMVVAVACLLLSATALARGQTGAASPEHAVASELANPMLLVWIVIGLPLLVAAKRTAKPGTAGLLWGLAGVTVSLFLMTRFGDTRSPRFVFPLYAALPLLLGLAVASARGLARGLAAAGVALSIGLNLFLLATVPGSVLQQPEHYVPRWMLPESSADLIGHLESAGATHAYAKYWLGTPLIFQSRERVITSNGAPGRHPPYDAAVRQSAAGVYIFYRGSPEQADLERLMAQRGVACARADVSAYRIYRDCGPGLRDALAGYLSAP